MAKSLRTLLKEDMKRRFIPVFFDKGFSLVPLPPEEKHFKLIHPFGYLKRKRDGNIDIVEIQFDKYMSPRFVINFGSVPKEGVTFPCGEHRDQEGAGLTELPENFRLYNSFLVKNHGVLASSLGIEWFGPGFFRRKNEGAVIKAVDRAIKLSEEMFDWFETGKIGKHIVRFDNQESIELLTKNKMEEHGDME